MAIFDPLNLKINLNQIFPRNLMGMNMLKLLIYAF